MTIHKEGYASIIIALLVLGALNIGFFYALSSIPWLFYSLLTLSVVFFSLIVYFFRRPAFTIQESVEDILSPADGKVVAIEEIEDREYFKDKRLQISVFMSPLNVHLNRYPISGEVKYFNHHNGHFHVAWHPKSSTENEHTSTVVQHQNGIDILFKQIAGAVARRIVSYADGAGKVQQGAECGFIKFGSRVDVLVPVDSKINVEIGEKVKGGKTSLASFS